MWGKSGVPNDTGKGEREMRRNQTMNQEQAIGYMLLACKELNLDRATVKKLKNAMCFQIAMRDIEEARKLGDTYFNEEVDVEDVMVDISETSIIGLLSPQSEQQALLEEEFQNLWLKYPRRLGKSNALRAYIRARKRGVSFDVIARGLESYLGYIDRNRLDTNYVKHGSTWFRMEGWEDDYSQ